MRNSLFSVPVSCFLSPALDMNTKLAMSVEEYLKTSFEDADCEYLDGEIVERNMGSCRTASFTASCFRC
jgi:hypothetical protein